MSTSIIPDASVGGGGAITPVLSTTAKNLYVGTVIVDSGSLNRTSAAKINAAASNPQRVTVAGTNSLLPLVYGRQQLAAKIGAVLVTSGQLYVLCAWCVGEIDAVESILIDSNPPVAGVVLTHYTGTQTQVADPTLVAAYAAQGITYADALPGVAYSVIVIPSGKNSSFPNVLATVRGLKVPLTSGGTPTWTENAAYCLADLIEHPTHGMGGAVDWTSVANVAADCASSIGSPAETKRLLDVSFDTQQKATDLVAVLADYAGCFAVQEGGTYFLIPDAAGSTVWTFTASNIVAGSMQVTKKAAMSQPTVVTVEYTDTSLPVYATQRVSAYASGVLAGTTPRMASLVQKPGITRYSEANRYAIERLNQAQLSDVNIQFDAFDEGVNLRLGDLIAVNHPIGFGPVPGFGAGKPFRVTSVQPNDAGRWTIAAAEYDPNQYSTVVATAPPVPDTSLPSPASPPAVTGLTVVEQVYQVQTGRFASRLYVTWDDASAAYPFVGSYAISLTQAGNVIESATVWASTQAYTTGPLAEDLLYSVAVQVRSSVGALGTAATASITNNGKLAKPSDVPSITGSEVGGQVRLTWTPATDLDLTATELRYGTVGVSWASATLLDRVAAPAVRYATDVVPAGTWDFLAKGLDSVRTATYPYGQESVNAARCTIAVTSDASAFIAVNQPFASPSLWNMIADAVGWQTSLAGSWNSIFTAALNSYANPLLTYGTTATSLLITAIEDAGAQITGAWSIDPAWTDYAGTAVATMELNAAGGEAAKTITGATNATPIVITATAHGYNNGDEVVIAGVGGNTAANGARIVASATTNTFALTDQSGANVAGNGAYTSGGTATRWVWARSQAWPQSATARYGRMRITTTGAMLVTSLGSLNCNVVTRNEGGFANTSASAPTIVTLANHYAKAASLTVTPQGTSAGTGVYNNIEESAGLSVGIGQTLRFDGVANHVEVADSTALRLATALTVEAWVKVSALTGAYQTVVRKDTETGTEYAWGLRVSNANYLQGFYNNGAVSFAVSQALFPAGNWVHLAMTISGTTLSIYQDGVLQGTTTITGTQGVPTGRMGIGATPPCVATSGAWAEWFGGVIDEVRVWNVARTQAQIQSDMSTPLVGNESGLVGYWKFDSLSGTVATDSTANANNGTVSGAEWRPLDGFDVYAFNSSGTQVAAPVSWAWSGV